MEMQKLSPNSDLNNFLASRQQEILSIAHEIAHKTTEEVVKTELALADFELLLSVNMQKKEQERLTKQSRKLREEVWEELSEKFRRDTSKIQKALGCN